MSILYDRIAISGSDLSYGNALHYVIEFAGIQRLIGGSRSPIVVFPAQKELFEDEK